jgi:WD40 repeat protein
MPDVFISYSRRDLEFVQRLDASLAERGKDVWVDWQDILPTAEWLEEVFEGVESSDNFLFVISPDSLASEVCARELGHALEQHKRLVPVVRRDAGGQSVPEPLAARNWTFFRDEDDYGASFETLVSALDTDLDWVGAHTRLLRRALEWEKEGREGSYLLRGRDLQEAEHWVASQSAQRDPRPTPLQLEYVLAARRAATRRQRILVGAALVAVAVSLGLALLALSQRNEARREARVALSRQLAAQANAERDVRPERSLALATRAAMTAETDEAREALSRSLQSSLPSSVVTVGTARVWDAAFSNDGKRLVTASEQGGVRIWDVRNPRSPHLVGSLRAKPTLMSARFSPDGRVVVTAGAAGAQIWRVARGTARPVASFGAAANMATFSPDGELLASAAADGLHLWDVRSRRPLGGLSRRAGRRTFVAVAFSPDGRRLAAATGSTATVWSVPAGRRLATLHHPLADEVWDVAFRPGSGQVVTTDNHGAVRVWQLPSGRLENQLSGHVDAVQSAAFSTDGRFLVTAGDDATARVWDAETHTTVAQLLGHSGSVLSASFRPDGRVIATGGEDGTLRLWPSPKQPALELTMSNRKKLRDIAFSPDGRRLVTASEDGTGRVWDGSSLLYILRHRRSGEAGDWVESASFSRDGSRILTAGSDGVAKVWSAKTGSLLTTVRREDGQPLFAADLSSDNALVAAGGKGGALLVWKLGTGAPPVVRNSPAERIYGVAFAPTGGLVASAAWDGALRLWKVWGQKAPVATLRGDRNPLLSVAFSPDGARVAAAGLSGSAWVWDVQSHHLVATLPGRQVIWGIGFSRDGRFLVTAGDDGVARVFASKSGRPVAELPSGLDHLEAAAFDPVRWSVAVAGERGEAPVEQGEAAVLDCVECRSLEELVCRAAERLTPQALAALPRDARDAIDSRHRQCDPGR